MGMLPAAFSIYLKLGSVLSHDATFYSMPFVDIPLNYSVIPLSHAAQRHYTYITTILPGKKTGHHVILLLPLPVLLSPFHYLYLGTWTY